MAIGTGDTVRHKQTRDLLMVSCCHPPIFYPLGYPAGAIRLDQVELVSEASDADRTALIRALAEAQANGHRNRCAREKLGATYDATGEG